MKCPTCEGTGKVRDLMHEVTDPCDLCEGTGQAIPSKVFDHFTGNQLVLEFPTELAAKIFKSWLCDGGGEQSFLDGQDIMLEQGDMDREDAVLDIDYFTGDETIRFLNRMPEQD